MKHQEFLVTTMRGKRSRRMLWDGHEPLALDHPAIWHLEVAPDGHTIRARAGEGDAAIVEFTDQDLEKGASLQLPNLNDPSNGLSVEGPVLALKKLKPIRAAYMPALEPKGPPRPPQFFVFQGQRYLMVDYKPAARSYRGTVMGHPIWGYVRNDLGYQLTAYREGVRLKWPGPQGGKKQILKPGVTEFVRDADFMQATVLWDKHWWRVNRIPTPEALPLDTFEDASEKDRRWFMRFGATVMAGLVAGFVVVKRVAEDYAKVEIPKPPTTIALKAPKIIPLPPKKPEPPKIVVKKPDPPKPKVEPPKIAKKPDPPKKKPEPPKVVKKPEPPKPKLAQKLPPPPKPLPPPKLPPAPAPKLAVQQPPPPKVQAPQLKTSIAPPAPVAAPQPKVDTALIQRQAAEQERARKQAQLARALNFLSPSVNKKASGGMFTDNTATKYNAGGPSAVSAVAGAKGPSVLNSIASNQVQDGVIQTTNSRNIASDKFTATGGKGKSLNEVQGKVSLSALYDPNAGSSLGGSLSGGGGLQMSGQGKLDEEAIRKALAKHLQRFQYCYEKALLNDPTLGGTVTMQWTIDLGGKAGSVSVVRSKMQNQGLFTCMSRELGVIRFPQPKGGSVTVKYPFSFTASTM
jgi:hypothetical protein